MTEQSTASRKATQIASEKQIASSKHSTKYVDERSKARRHRSTARRRSKAQSPKQRTASEAKHDVSHAYSVFLAKSFFSYFVPPFRRSRRGRWAPAVGAPIAGTRQPRAQPRIQQNACTRAPAHPRSTRSRVCPKKTGKKNRGAKLGEKKQNTPFFAVLPYLAS